MTEPGMQHHRDFFVLIIYFTATQNGVFAPVEIQEVGSCFENRFGELIILIVMLDMKGKIPDRETTSSAKSSS